LVIEGNVGKAHWLRIEMIQEIANSPDLTDTHKEELMLSFEAAFQETCDRYAERPEQGGKDRAVRGPGGSNAAPFRLQRVAQLANDAGFSVPVTDEIMNLSERWRTVSEHGRALASPEVTDQEIGEHLKGLRGLRKGKGLGPANLADALTIPFFSPR
jgi:hypothetical protein